MSRQCDAITEQMSIASYPFPQKGSCAVRFYPTSGWYSTDHAILTIYTDPLHSFAIHKGAPGNTWYIGWYSGGVDGRVIFTGELTDDNGGWNLITVSWDATRTDKTQVWTMTAANKSTSLTTEDLSAKTLYIGNHNGEYTMNGLMGEVAIWNEAFGADTLAAFCAEDQAMRSGRPMNRIRPSALVDHWPLAGFESPEPSWSGSGRNLTVTGATLNENNPTISPYRLAGGMEPFGPIESWEPPVSSVQKWTTPAAAETIFSGSDLGNLGNMAVSTSSVVVDNSAGLYEYVDVEYYHAGSVTGSNPTVQIWFLQSLDDGSNYEDSARLYRPPDAVFPLRVNITATQRVTMCKIPIPPYKFKVLFMNWSGASLAMSGTVLKLRRYYQQVV